MQRSSNLSTLMKTVLAGLVRSKCLVYLDDILVVGCTVQEHLGNLRHVLQRLQAAALNPKVKKYSFKQAQVEYLRHIVSVDQSKTAVV